MTQSTRQTPTRALCLFGLLFFLAGCATQGGDTPDNALSTSVRLSDAELELDLRERLEEANPEFSEGSIRIVSVDGRVLIVGTVPDSSLVDEATEVARSSDRLRLLHNELQAMPGLSAGVKATDQWISVRVKGRLIAERSLPTSDLKVVTFRGTVYLMGSLDQEQRRQALELAAQVQGVQRVVSLLDQTSG